MKLGRKVIIKIIMISCIIYFFLASLTFVQGRAYDTACGEYVAKYAEEFIAKYGYNSRYLATDTAGWDGEAFGSTFRSCCTSGVRYMYQQALGIDIANYGWSGWASNNLSLATSYGQYWEEVPISQAKAGDVLVRSGHAEMMATGGQHANFGRDQYPENCRVHPSCNMTKAFRLKSNVDVTPSGTVPQGSDEEKEDRFFYNGMPKSGEYTGSSSLTLSKAFEWLINALSQIIDYIIGLFTMGIKIQLIGWTNIFENVVTDAVNDITGTDLEETNSGTAGTTEEGSPNTNREDSTMNETELYTPASTELKPEGSGKLTVEKIIYNEVPILDINVFNLEEAGGKKLDPNGTLSIIKKNVAEWYYAFRKVTIVGLLLVLIYMGIRMAITTIAQEKAKYKRLLIDWTVSFIIVFTIHYLMIFIIDANEFLVSHIKNMAQGSEIPIYEIVRTKAYELKFTSGITGTVMYMILVYLMIRFLYVYIKRFLTINILVIIAPLMGISYSIDRIKDNKNQVLSNWLKDFTFMVFLQSIHALIYGYFVTTALKLSDESLYGIMLAFIMMNFMLKAERIAINVFDMGGTRTMNSILEPDSLRNSLAALGVLGFAGSIYAGGARIAGRTIKGTAMTVGQIGGVVLPKSFRYRFNDMYNRGADRLLGNANYLKRRRTNDIKTVSGIDKKLEAQRQMNLTLRRKMRKDAIGYGTRMLKGVAYGFFAVPTIIMSPGVGFGYAMLSYSNIASHKRKTKKGNKDPHTYLKLKHMTTGQRIRYRAKEGVKSFGRGMKGMAVATVTGPIRPLINQARRNNEMRAKERKLKEQIMVKIPTKMSALQEAKQIEENIIETYNQKKQVTIGENLDNRDRMRTVSSVLATKQFDASYDKLLEESFRVTNIVEEFAKENKTETLKTNQINKIVDKVLEEKISDATTKSLEVQLEMAEENSEWAERESIVRSLNQYREEKAKEFKEEVNATLKESVNDHLSKELDLSLKASGNKAEISDGVKKTITKDLTKLIVRNKSPEVIKRQLDKSLEENHVEGSLTEATKVKLVDDLIKKAEKNTKKAYTTDEVIASIEKALKKEKIKPDVPQGFEEIATNIEKLKEMNRSYKKKYGEDIYEDLQDSMKKVKYNEPFDLYTSIRESYKKK